MRIKLLGFFLLIGYFHGVRAQQWSYELWHEGTIVLVDGDTLKGLVKYDLMKDIVQFEMPNVRSEAFTARKVLTFEIFDSIVQRYRRFFSLPYTTPTAYKVPVFFELIEEGPITVLAREALDYVTYSPTYSMGSYTRLEIVYSYFFLEENGNIVEFKPDRKVLLEKMKRREEEVEKYIKKNHLSPNNRNPYDLARIVAYYNSLIQPPN